MPETRVATLIDGCLHFRRLLTRLYSRLLPPTDPGGEDFDTLLISLPGSEARRQTLLRRMDAGNWRLQSLDACHPADPESLSEAEWRRFHAMAERLRPGQRGCFLSHRRAWLRARESTAPLVIVLEDDVIPATRSGSTGDRRRTGRGRGGLALPSRRTPSTRRSSSTITKRPR